MQTIWQNNNFKLIRHESELPWVKLFTNKPYKELSHLPKELKLEMFELIENIEIVMIEIYKPDKINIASFGNILPHMHWHIISRFQSDPYFPKTTWEEAIREFNLNLPPFENFIKRVNEVL